AFATVGRGLRQAEEGACRQTQRFTGFGGQTAADDQWNTSTSLHFDQQDIRLKRKLRTHCAGFDVKNLALIRTNLDHVAHIEIVYRCFKDQRAGIFHGVVENWSYFAADADAAGALVGYAGDIVANEPEY